MSCINLPINDEPLTLFVRGDFQIWRAWLNEDTNLPVTNATTCTMKITRDRRYTAQNLVEITGTVEDRDWGGDIGLVQTFIFDLTEASKALVLGDGIQGIAYATIYVDDTPLAVRKITINGGA